MVGFHMAYGLVAMLFGLVVLIGIVAGVVVLVRLAAAPSHPLPPPPGSPPQTPAREGPLDILARRFASGEITAEEYQKAKDLLKQ